MRFAVVVVALAGAAGGCAYSGAPANGEQECAPPGGKRCPDGYFCAANNTCWQNGTVPQLDGGPNDGPGSGGVSGTGGGSGAGGSVIGGRGGAGTGGGGGTSGTSGGGPGGSAGGAGGTGGSAGGAGGTGGSAAGRGGGGGTGGGVAGTGGGTGGTGGAPVLHMISVVKAGSGSGRVTSTTAGIDCGSDCFESYSAGAMVTLTAAADASSTFTGWSGGTCTGTAPCTLTVSAAATVTATFSLRTWVLTTVLAGSGGGTVTSNPTGINCGTDCTETYGHGTMVALTAAPNGQSLFTGWSGACTGGGACTVTMDQARNVTATFTAQSYGLTVIKAGNGASLGGVTSIPAGIECGADCSEAYAAGTTVMLTASAAAGARFTGWSDPGCGTALTCAVTIGGVVSITATFTLVEHTLTVLKSGSGAGTVSSTPTGINCGTTCVANFAYGTTVSLTPVADPNSLFTGWGGACSGTGACVVTMNQARSATATFVPTYVVTTAVSGGPAGTVISPTSSTPGSVCSGAMCRVPAGGAVAATAPSLTNWFFEGWSGAVTTTTPAVTISNVTANATITARYINTRSEPCRDSPPANGATTSRPNVTTTYTTAGGWSLPAVCPWACNVNYCATASMTCVVTYVDQISYATGAASKWYGGDDRAGSSRSVGTGQSITPSAAVVMDRFGLAVNRGFSYASNGQPATTAINLRLERRTSAGAISATYNVVVPVDYADDWVYWTTPSTTLAAGTTQIFTSWMTNAFSNPVNSGTSGDSAAGFALGEGFSGSVTSGDLTAWANWGTHPWDFHFRIQRRNTQCQ
jgi:hypothetical protein